MSLEVPALDPTFEYLVSLSSHDGDGIETIDMHPDLAVAESNRLNGGTDPRFDDWRSVLLSRMSLMAKVGCESAVILVPQMSATYHDLDRGRITADKEDYRRWPEYLRPREDPVYDPDAPPYMMDLPGDGLITATPGKGLEMHTGDCAAVVMYDPVNGLLALPHIGRQGAELDIGPETITYLQGQYLTDPKNLLVYFGSSIAPESYTLTYLSETLRQEVWRPYIRETSPNCFETDFIGFAIQRLIEKGVPGENIKRSLIKDVATHPNYFSFAEHQKSKGVVPDGRNGFIAMIRQPLSAVAPI